MTNEQIVIRIKAGIDVAENMLALWENNQGIISGVLFISIGAKIKRI